ncbi:acyltransferase family protein, partial [Nostoc sp. NIES-2111]
MNNNFGFLRLVFALLVILAHSPEMIDGNRDREILTRLTGSMSFGELAVDGFFLISGYLITQSFERSSSVFEYVTKRVLRIYPGFIVAFVILLLVVVPLGGGHIDPSGSFLGKAIYNLAILSPLQVDGVFEGLAYPFLDAPMWTIPYEFRCYLLVVVFAAIGLNRHRAVYAGITAGLLGLAAFGVHYELGPVARITGQLQELCRLLSVFMVGGVYSLSRDVVRYAWRIAGFAAILLPLLLMTPPLAETAWAVLGGYLVFWFAFQVRSDWMQN